MHAKQFDVLADAIIVLLKKVITPLRAEMRAENAKLKAELAECVKFRGTFEGGKSYREGDMVRHQGSLWICKIATQGTPSKDFVGWELALKKGDAR